MPWRAAAEAGWQPSPHTSAKHDLSNGMGSLGNNQCAGNRAGCPGCDMGGAAHKCVTPHALHACTSKTACWQPRLAQPKAGAHAFCLVIRYAAVADEMSDS